MATTKAAEEFDARAFARTSRPNRGGVPCQTCSQYPKVVEKTRDALEVWVGGEGIPAYGELHRHLAERMGYALSKSALEKHIHRCEPELAAQLRERRGE